MSRSRLARLLVPALTILLLCSLAGLPAARAAESSSGAPGGSSPQSFIDDARAKRETLMEEFRPAYASDHVVASFGTVAQAAREARARGSKVLETIGGGAVLLDVPSGQGVRGFVRALRRDPDVEYAEPDFVVRAFAQDADVPQVTQWGVEAVKSEEAEATNGVTGDGVTVAIVDTGIDYTHVDLDDNIWVNAGEDDGDGVLDGRSICPATDADSGDFNCADDDGNGFVDDVVGYDFIGPFFTDPSNEDNDPMDALGHGTHVAGIVGAEDNSVGVRGVAPGATLMAVRVLDDIGAGWDSGIARGIRYAADNGADIINMSLGSYSRSALLAEAVDYASDKGVAIVAAAGNAFFYSLPSFPAAYPAVISVSAAPEPPDGADPTKIWWSDWGHADFLAPGVEILSTTPDDRLEILSGTSMASPHVAGALALVQEELEDQALGSSPAKLEQALASAATDVYFAGKDEVSGSGFPDAEAATTIPRADEQVELYRDEYLIPSDGVSGSEITLRILDEDGDPVVGETGAFSTDKGSLSDTSFSTDGGGEATTTLTVDDDFGSATVTADPDTVGIPSRSLRVIVEDDRVRVDDVQILPSSGEEEEEEIFDGAEPEPGREPSSGIEAAVPQPGDTVVLTAFLGRHNFAFEEEGATFEWTVTDPDGFTVDALSGEMEEATIFGFGGQGWFNSTLMTVPEDAAAGKYHVTGTATTVDTGETHTLEKDFSVGQTTAEFLIVQGATVFDAETFNFLWEHVTDSVVRQAVEDTGRTFTFWDTRLLGTPSAEALTAHSNVIWLGGWSDDLDLDAVRTYLDAGGNLLVSGDQFATFARLNSSSTTYQDALHAQGLLTTFFPDVNHQQYPMSVTAGDTDFDDLDALAGATLDIDSYDLNHSGESTAIFTDELKLFDPDALGAETLFEYPTGANASGGFDTGFEAGVVLDDGFSRVIDLGFGIEAVDDGSSPATLADVIDTIHGFFNPPPEISDVFPSAADNSGDEFFFVEGDGFQPTGKTKVSIGTRLVSPVVLDRTLMLVDVPAGMSLGLKDVKVVNPDGDEDTLVGGVTITRPAPVIQDVEPNFGSNDRRRSFLVKGLFFRPTSKVYLAGVRLDTDYWSTKTLKAFMPAGFTPLGEQNVKVINPDGQRDTEADAYRVRFGFTFNFGLGSNGTHVEWLQKRMKKYGYFPSSEPITGTYGPITARAVRRFQNARDLTITGTVNTETRRELNDKL